MANSKTSQLGRPGTFFASAAPLYEYWKKLPKDKPRKALRAEQLGARLLPHVSLLQVLGQAEDLRYDLICQEMKIIAPRLVPGSLGTDPLKLNPSDRGVLDLLLGAALKQRPSAHLANFKSYEGHKRSVFTLILPLGLNAQAISSKDLIVSVWQRPSKLDSDQEVFEDMTEEFLTFCASRTPS